MASQLNKSKICQTCGLRFEYRKKWAKNWDEVKYCSERCRSSKLKNAPALREQILARLHQVAQSATICPSEVLPPELKSNHAEMERVRQAARLLVAEGLIEICQRGRVVDPNDFRGPIRLRLKK